MNIRTWVKKGGFFVWLGLFVVELLVFSAISLAFFHFDYFKSLLYNFIPAIIFSLILYFSLIAPRKKGDEDA